MSVLERVMISSTPNVQTGCRVWNGKTNPEGEPTIQVRKHTAQVKYYLTAKKWKRQGFFPVFKNSCGNQLCVTISHVEIVEWRSRISIPAEAGK